MHSPTLDWHNKDNPKNKGDNLLLATTGLPADVDQYITFSQIAQAEGLKFGVEHFRRRKPHCSGTLVWQLDDCWPVLSWSVLDYYGFPKASYYFLKRAYAPLLASFRTDEDALELWLTNDRASDITDRVTLSMGTFDGRNEWQESRDVAIAAGSSACAWRLDNVRGSPAHYVHARSASGAFPANRHFFVDIKDLVRPSVAPRMTLTAVSPHELKIQLEAPIEAYVYFAHVTSAHESVRFSDNYVDVRPGEVRELLATDPLHALRPEDLRLGCA
jgi:beta-mannosidase